MKKCNVDVQQYDSSKRISQPRNRLCHILYILLRLGSYLRVLHPPADPLLNVDLAKRFSIVGEKVRLSSLKQGSSGYIQHFLKIHSPTTHAVFWFYCLFIFNFDKFSSKADRAGWRGHTWTMMTSNRSLQLAPTMKDIPLSTVSKGELVITNNCFPASTNLKIHCWKCNILLPPHISYLEFPQLIAI